MFISPDSIIPDLFNPQSFNPFAYCLNNPLRYIDPSGHGIETPAGGNYSDEEKEELTKSVEEAYGDDGNGGYVNDPDGIYSLNSTYASSFLQEEFSGQSMPDNEQLYAGTVLSIRIPHWVRMSRFFRRVNPKKPPEKNPSDPRFEPSRPPSSEEIGVPPEDTHWQSDPMKQDPFRTPPKYNPNAPPKNKNLGPMVPESDPNQIFDPDYNPGGYT